MSDCIDRSYVETWLRAQLEIWAGEEIAPEHLLKLLISDVKHLTPVDHDA